MMDISARNTLKGAVKRVLPGAVNTEVIVEVADGNGLLIEFMREIENPTFSGLEVLAIADPS